MALLMSGMLHVPRSLTDAANLCYYVVHALVVCPHLMKCKASVGLVRLEGGDASDLSFLYDVAVTEVSNVLMPSKDQSCSKGWSPVRELKRSRAADTPTPSSALTTAGTRQHAQAFSFHSIRTCSKDCSALALSMLLSSIYVVHTSTYAAQSTCDALGTEFCREPAQHWQVTQASFLP